MFEGKIIIGSASPRRKQLVEGLGLPCEVRKKSIDEHFPEDLDVYKVPEYLAKLKSTPLIDGLGKDEVLLTSDTVVIMNDEILHKPKDAGEAKEMLLSLSGNMNEVITGVCLTSRREQIVFSSKTSVHFSRLREADIDHYIQQFEPYDKAGAYGIQEWIGQIGVKRIEGCFYNVMGLPVHLVWEHLHSSKFSKKA